MHLVETSQGRRLLLSFSSGATFPLRGTKRSKMDSRSGEVNMPQKSGGLSRSVMSRNIICRRSSSCFAFFALSLGLVGGAGAFAPVSSFISTSGMLKLGQGRGVISSFKPVLAAGPRMVRGGRGGVFATTVAQDGHPKVVTEKTVWERPSPRGNRDVVIGTKIHTRTPVSSKADEGFNLGAYMMLPPEQYVLIPLPNKAKLDRIDSGNFRLRVPELQFLNVWVRPMCEASVDVTKNGVVIEVTKCHLEGSPEVSRLNINSRFELSMKVVLSAREDPRGLKSVMVGLSELSVWVDPPSIFRAMFPRRLMESTGNAVLRTSLNLLQTTFLQGLAKDYEEWATDAKYRQTREEAGAEARTVPAK